MTRPETNLMRKFQGREGAPTKAVLDNRLTTLLGALEKEGSRAARTLIDCLEACTRRHPCKSAACPHCRNREQLMAMVRLHKVWPEGTELVTTSVIIQQLERLPGSLHTLKLDSIKRSLRRKLKDAGCELIPIWAYIDLSFNSHAQNEYSAHWLPHPHIITEAKFADNLARLRDQLKRSTSIKRPMKILPIEDWEAAVSYACKPEPKRRCDYKRNSSKASPSDYPLTPAQAAEAALWLAGYHPRERHFWCVMPPQEGGLVNDIGV